MKYTSILSFLISVILAYIFLPMLINMISSTSLVCKNYKGIKIPTSMGLTFIFTQVLTFGILELIFNPKDGIVIVYLLGFIFIGLLGLLDDSIGNDKYKGLKGHIGAFFKGELTTGNIKALLGSFIALYVSSILSDNYLVIFINGMLIALFTNLMNLFDLRPGRAGKIFILISLAMIALNLRAEYNYIIYALLGSLCIYMPYDLRAEIMMGDTGSNALGYTLGFYAANSLNIYMKIIVIIILLTLHYLAEKISFSKLIKESKVLNYIDMIGR